MSIINSKTGEIRKDYSVEELIQKAKEMRAYRIYTILLSKGQKKLYDKKH